MEGRKDCWVEVCGVYDMTGVEVLAVVGGSMRLAIDGAADARFRRGDVWAEGVPFVVLTCRGCEVSMVAARTGS